MKLSLDALKERAGAVASEELMITITGGVEEACHDGVSSLADLPLVLIWSWLTHQ